VVGCVVARDGLRRLGRGAHRAAIRRLAVVLGIALVLGGGVKIAGAFFGGGDERLILGLVWLTSVVVGLLVLSWPSATVLVLTLVVGVGTALFGFGQIALAVKLRGAQPDSV
jgi:uncharacterized membrane protein HdeD (DUF308 family)